MVGPPWSQVQEAFCQASGARNFFTLEDQETKRLMHGAVVTAHGGHIFFEDISLNPFKDSLKVPFTEYRCNHQGHVILQLVYFDMNAEVSITFHLVGAL